MIEKLQRVNVKRLNARWWERERSVGKLIKVDSRVEVIYWKMRVRTFLARNRRFHLT